MLPFLATFAIGIFIASFFVTIGRPGLRARGWERQRMNEQLRMENEELRNENLRLRNDLENQRSSWDGFYNDRMPMVRGLGPEVPVPMPAIPSAPHTHR